MTLDKQTNNEITNPVSENSKDMPTWPFKIQCFFPKPNGNDLNNLSDLGYQALKQSNYASATSMYRQATEIDMSKSKDQTDHMLYSTACVILGILLTSTSEYRDDYEAVSLFESVATKYKVPAACFLYGSALVYGTGGTERDISKGIRLLNQAGSRGISESYVLLGALYEGKVDANNAVVVNPFQARRFNEASFLAELKELERSSEGGCAFRSTSEYEEETHNDWYGWYGQLRDARKLLQIDPVLTDPIIDDDGLQKFNPVEKNNRWPFNEVDSNHEYWVEKKRDSDPPTHYACYMEGQRFYASFMEGRIDDLDWIPSLKSAAGVMPLTPEDHMFQAMSCVMLGIIFLITRPPRLHLKLREAATLFKKASVIYELPHAKYFYGYLLVYGKRGVKQEIEKGIALLQEAAAEGISEAYITMGLIFERGFPGQVAKNFNLASSYYDASARIGPSATMEFLSNEFGFRTWMPGVWVFEAFSQEYSGILSQGNIGAMIGEQHYWTICEQSFLIAAAVLVTSAKDDENENIMKIVFIFIFTLGIVLAFFSAVYGFASVRNRKEYQSIYKMVEAKTHAFHRLYSQHHKLLVEEGRTRTSRHSEIQFGWQDADYTYLKFYVIRDWQDEKHIRFYLIQVGIHLVWAWLVERAYHLIPILFLLIWVGFLVIVFWY